MINERIKDWLFVNTSCGLDCREDFPGIVYGVVKAKSIANKIRSRGLPIYKKDLTDSRINHNKED